MQKSLKSEIIKQWKNSNCPQWTVTQTVKVAIECDKKINPPPAPRFREALQKNDEKYLKQWVQGCRFPWLKEKSETKKQILRADPKIKTIGDNLLNHINFVLDTVSADDQTLRFKLNRWIYTRLHQKEIQFKRPIKKELWISGNKQCSECRKEFKTMKNVEIHRKDQDKIYSIENCVLVCKECHEKI
jgi:hypothetical protein